MRYVSTTVLCWILLGSPESSAQSVRRLIVSGNESSVSAYPSSVALLYCETDWGIAKNCAIFCSGSLIAPNLVLTAGHCVYDSDSPFKYPRPPTPLSSMFVMLGSSSNADFDSAKVVKVKSVINGGYATNLRFPFDDDIGLLFLSECVTLIPGKIETIQLATPDIDSQISSQCTSVTTTGYGRHENVPAELYVSDGKLRVIRDTVHSFETCKAANIDAMGEAFGIPENSLQDMIVPSKHLCAGGDTIWSTCNGDSGGPVIMESPSRVQIGITSFGPAGFCGTTPDYSTRVSNYGSWIHQVVANMSMCSGWTVERMFAGNIPSEPVPVTSRCPAGDWQCPISGECIDLANVCDGTPHCKDKQDEDKHFCRMVILGRSEPLVGAANSADSAPDNSSAPLSEAVKREFQSLLRTKKISDDDLVAGIFDSPTVRIVGLIESVSKFSLTRSLSSLGRARTQDEATKICNTPEYTKALTQTIQKDCKEVLHQVTDQISKQKEAKTVDLNNVIGTCKILGECVESSTNEQSFDEWLIQLDICMESNPRKFFSILGSHQSAISVCGSAEYFAEQNSTRISYTNSFNAKYNSTLCSSIPLPEERFSASSYDDTKSATTNTINLYSTYVLLILMYQIFWL